MARKFVVHGVAAVPTIREVESGLTVRQLVEMLIHEGHEVRMEDASVALRDADVEIDMDATVLESIPEAAHIHVTCQCKNVHVVVRYVGPPYRERSFRASDTIGKILAWAEDAYGIADNQRGQFRLKLPDQQAYLENDDHVGELVAAAPCELRLDLVRTEQNAG